MSRLDIGSAYTMQISFRPDGKQLAALVPAANDKIFIYDFQRQIMTRLTNTPGNDAFPVWSPDGNPDRLSRTTATGRATCYVIPADGSAPARRILASPFNDIPNTWSPDGTEILFTRVDAGGKAGDLDHAGRRERGTEAVVRLRALQLEGQYLAGRALDRLHFGFFGRSRTSMPGPLADLATRSAFRLSDGRSAAMVSRRQDHLLPSRSAHDGRPGRGRGDASGRHAPGDLRAGRDGVRRPAPRPDGDRFLANRANPQMRKHFGIRVVFDWTDQLNELEP